MKLKKKTERIYYIYLYNLYIYIILKEFMFAALWVSYNQRQLQCETAGSKSSLALNRNTGRYKVPPLLHLKASLMMPSTLCQTNQSSEVSGINSGSIMFFPVFKYLDFNKHWTSHQRKWCARSLPALQLQRRDAFRVATQRPLLSLAESPGCNAQIQLLQTLQSRPEITASSLGGSTAVPGRGARGGRDPSPARRGLCRRRAGQAWPRSRPSPPGPSARRGGGSSRRASRPHKSGRRSRARQRGGRWPAMEQPVQTEMWKAGSLEELVRILHRLFAEDKVSVEEVQALMESYESNPDEWLQYAQFDQYR